MNFLLDKLKEIHGMKINILLKTTFVKQNGEEQDAHIKTRATEITNDQDIGDVISDSNNEREALHTYRCPIN